MNKKTHRLTDTFFVYILSISFLVKVWQSMTNLTADACCASDGVLSHDDLLLFFLLLIAPFFAAVQGLVPAR